MSAKNITQTSLSIISGVPRNSLNRKLTGGTFSFDELARIAAALETPLSFIIRDAETNPDGADGSADTLTSGDGGCDTRAGKEAERWA